MHVLQALTPAVVVIALAERAASAQDVATQLRRLSAVEAPQREDARRRLAGLARADLPADALLALVRAGEVAAVPAAQLLALRPDLHAALRRQLDLTRAEPALLAAALPALETAQVWQVLSAALPPEPALAELALAELFRRDALDAPDLMAVLRQEDPPGPAAVAAELLAHAPLPSAAVLDALAALPAARQRLLRALADHPRHDYADWLRPWVERADDATTTLYAIAALPPDAQSQAHARLVLRLFDAETQPFLYDLAAARFSAKIADGLVSGAHAAVLAGRSIDDLLPLFTNVSPAGEAHLLGLAMTLPADGCEAVCRWLDLRDSAALAQRVAAALDGEIGLDDQWLRRAGPLLTTDARVARVADLLADGEPRSVEAFAALIEANRYDPRMLALIEGGGEAVQRARDLLRLPRAVLPVSVARSLLQHADPSVRLAAVHDLAVPELDPDSEARLARLLAEDDDDRVRAACARALTAFAGDARAAAAFAAAFGSAYGDEAVEWLLLRPRPFGLAMLQAARQARTSPRQLDELDTGLVRLGDHRPLPGLLARVHDLPLRLIRRLVPVLSTIDDAALVQRVRTAATDVELDEARREPLIAALAARPDRDVAFLRQVFEREEDDGLRSAALRGLLGTPAGDAMLAEAAAKIGVQALQRRDEDLAFVVLGAAPLPLSAAVVEFAARLVLVAPLASPVAEAALTLSDGGVGADYPLVQPLVELIRRDPRGVHGEVIAKVVGEARMHANAHALSRRRLGHLLGYLTLGGAAFQSAAPALARAIVAAPDTDATWLGPAWLVVARDAEGRGDLAAAAAAFASAHRHFLLDPGPSMQRRRFLAEPDPPHGLVPLAALAARPCILRARVALAAADVDAARRELAAARTLASCDQATLDQIAGLAAEMERR